MKGAKQQGECVFVPIVQQNQKQQNTKSYLAKKPKSPIIDQTVAAQAKPSKEKYMPPHHLRSAVRAVDADVCVGGFCGQQSSVSLSSTAIWNKSGARASTDTDWPAGTSTPPG